MLTLGIDPGTATTGFGLVIEKKSKLKHVAYGCFKTSSKEKAETRLSIIYKELKKVVKKHKPDAVAIEKIYFGKNVTSAMSVAQARGIILLACAELQLPIAHYSPLEVKLAVTGYGKADKYQVQTMVKKLLSLKDIPKPDDAADALAIAICHLHSYKVLKKVLTNDLTSKRRS